MQSSVFLAMSVHTEQSALEGPDPQPPKHVKLRPHCGICDIAMTPTDKFLARVYIPVAVTRSPAGCEPNDL